MVNKGQERVKRKRDGNKKVRRRRGILDEGIGLLIPEGSYSLSLSLSFSSAFVFPLLLFPLLAFHSYHLQPPECERVRVCLCAFEKHVSEVTQTE